MADKEEKKDEAKKEEEVLTLAQVHDQTIAKLEHEGDDDDSAKDDSDTGDKDAGADKDAADGDDKAGDEDESKDADAGEAPVGAAIPDKQLPAEKPEEDEPAPELNEDTTKKGPGKITVKDVDGGIHYFNNLDEVPDDFEPATYKHWGQVVQKFTEKSASDRVAQADAETKAEEAERSARIDAIKADWDKDIKILTDAKSLPSDETEKKVVTDAVFAIMNEKLAEGRVIDFATGYELHEGRKGKDTGAEAKAKVAEDKKKRGAMVSGAGTGGGAANKPKIMEAPPSGLTLDDIHMSVLDSL